MQKNSRLIKCSVCGGVALAAVILDQITKLLVVKNFDNIGDSVDIIRNVLRFTYVTNDGSAFGMLSDARWVFMLFSTLGILAMAAYVICFAKENSWFTTVSFGMVIGGGIGNMIDRLFNGETFGNGVVIDFIDFCAFPEVWKYIFNVADACVCIGAGLIMLYLVLDIARTSKEAKQSAKTGEKAADEEAEIGEAEEETEND